MDAVQRHLEHPHRYRGFPLARPDCDCLRPYSCCLVARLGRTHARGRLSHAQRRPRPRLLIFGGIISVLFGALLVVAPLMGAIVLTWWLGAYVLVSSILMLALAFTLRSRMSRPEG